MPQDRKDSSAADTTKHTLAELLPGPDPTPTPPPKTPTPTNKNNGNNSNSNNNCRNMMAQNPFDDPHGRPSPGMMQQMQMRPGLHPQQGPHPQGPHGPQCVGMHPGMMHGPGGPNKVYPAHQPMVFNPSNPNAPPIYPCGICHKEVHENDQAILCESGCNFWFHRICTGLTDDAFTMLKSEVYAEWVCDRCLSTKNIPLVKFKP
ncbi:hypothetical protein V1264_001623 [Littorina saxatilis]